MGVDGASAALGNNLGWQWFKDPRLDCLGYRGIFASSTTRKTSSCQQFLSTQLSLIIFDFIQCFLIFSLSCEFTCTSFVFLTAPLVESDKEANEQNYLLWRVERGIAEGSTEIPKGLHFVFVFVYVFCFCFFPCRVLSKINYIKKLLMLVDIMLREPRFYLRITTIKS